MSALALVRSGAPVPPNGTVTAGKLQLQVEDALASARRVWIRGQIRNLIPPLDLPSPKRRWWTRWTTNGHSDGPVQMGPLPDRLTLETRDSVALCQSEVPLPADGRSH